MPRPDLHAMTDRVLRLPGASPALRILADIARGDVTDRSMTLAAQAFTSILPLVILMLSLPGSDVVDSALTELGIPMTPWTAHPSTPPRSFATFGIVGALMTIAGATSLSRALGRMYVAVWGVTKLPGVRSGVGSWSCSSSRQPSSPRGCRRACRPRRSSVPRRRPQIARDRADAPGHDHHLVGDLHARPEVAGVGSGADAAAVAQRHRHRAADHGAAGRQPGRAADSRRRGPSATSAPSGWSSSRSAGCSCSPRSSS